MSINFFNKFKDDRKYFAIVLFVIILIFLTGFLTPIVVDNLQENWNKELSQKIINIENSVNSLYETKEEHLLSVSKKIHKNLSEILKPGNISYGSLVKLANHKDYQDFSIEIFAPNGRLIAWSDDIAIQQEELFPLTFPAGDVYFHNSSLRVYLSVVDTLHLESDLFYFTVSLPIEKKYTLQNRFYKEISFTKEVSENFFTQFEIDYIPFAQLTKDGRRYSFDLLNNNENKIALVTFVKPALDTSMNNVYSVSSSIQSILIFIGLVFLGFGFKKDFKEIDHRLIKLFLFALYCASFRMIIYWVGFPSNLLEGQLTDPSYFSSAFGGGIVKSPIEFFITAIFFLLFSLMAFKFLLDYIKHNPEKKVLFFLLILPITFFFLWILRALNASLRSTIFDSTLRYFKDVRLIPDIPSMMMNLNVLILGTGIILILTGTVILLISLLSKSHDKKARINFIILFFFFQICGYLFLIFQKEPLITPLLSIVFITIIFILAYHYIFINPGSIYNYIYAALAASIITIALLNYFNLKLERESLKTAALEINRPSDNLLEFIIKETLEAAVKDENIINTFIKKDVNFTAAAFQVWSASSLQRESMNSSIVIYDKNKKILGEFGVGIYDELKYPDELINYFGNDLKIVELTKDEDQSRKDFSGIIPVTLRGITLGYISSSLSFSLQNIGAGNIPDFLESRRNIINSVVNLHLLKIFEFTDSKLTQVFGDIYPSRDQIKPILDADFEDNEAWLNISLNEENYIIYLLKTELNGSEKITAVALREKHFSWNLFNFFKIFIVHSIFILALFLLFFLYNLRTFKYSFRTQLLISFLLISIVPVFILAIYNREIVAQRTETAIFNELNERSKYLENHIRSQLEKHKDRNFKNAFDNAASELGISFGIYETTDQIYNSKEQFYEAGLFTSRINPMAYYHLNYLSYREYLNQENLDNFNYDAFYKKIILQDKDFILGVNDAFNKVRLSFSTISIDVFLFGVYSFASIIIIIISTIFANRISSPIRKLTKATQSVAQGDLNVQLEGTERGEIKELFDGFNQMTKELQHNQAELAEFEREIAWKEMAKQVAHEIKNPLTPMKLAVQQLIATYNDKSNNHPSGEARFESIFEKVSATILNQIDNLSLIASEFSRFARMPRYKLEEVDLINVINDSMNLFVDEKVVLENKSVLELAVVEADKSQMRRLFINLIRNSIQADATKISFYLTEKDSYYTILVKDNGTGIPAELREKIFETNFTTKEKGMGIGLKLAKRFLEVVNGKIELVEDALPGTTFKIELPVYKQV